ncbi:protein-L-isoaspartate(D-aspartate) O-methyltransferase [Roseibium hamelinense]|uniref:Protein-L-isoaspartate O-methyltransferase n=1 Tax=Roseibium hamelinense TaxID=150831 RepID=A0A562TJW8_9HYPH|nr:protein-L-isoaspartate(D-aspartate) O-methyltransferase [Roseibium hamelinense]MTI45677.1 protein-L-isoaspartate(D-aspartate) O-methyltransferase [Roseibium hamelinense]TWI93140.1 protein-L-isoaspartate(D-aspartate) O-methyltransferase [Roseibium hamelinense]
MSGSAISAGSTALFEEAARVAPDEAEARAALVLTLRGRGIGDRAVLSAIERVPRRLFLAARYHRLAYDDAQLPIECGQVVSAPSRVALIAQALQIKPDHAVLEIGTGSGYQAAVLGHLAGRVETIDRYRSLSALAAQRLAALKLNTVTVHHADGLAGLKSRAPFDRIILTGSVTEIPEVLYTQLAPAGMIIAPVGPPGSPQVLTRIRRTETADVADPLGQVRSVGLTRGVAEIL